jgi:hypothetical protein
MYTRISCPFFYPFFGRYALGDDFIRVDWRFGSSYEALAAILS